MENKNKKFRNIKGFTLVELIVVITIVAILATIAFVNFQGYTVASRDTMRISSIKNIQTWMETYAQKKWVYPSPDEWIILTWNTWSYITQWIIWSTVQDDIWIQSNVKDPLNWNPFIYSIFWNWSYYQVATYNEEVKETTYLQSSHAATLWAIVSWNYKLDPSLPSLVTVTWSVSSSWIFDSGVCFLTNWWINNPDSISWSCLKKKDMKFSNDDKTLVWYWDMESVTNLWLLKDLSWNWNHWTASATIWWTQWIVWKAISFNWTNNYISIGNNFYQNNNYWTIISVVKCSSWNNWEIFWSTNASIDTSYIKLFCNSWLLEFQAYLSWSLNNWVYSSKRIDDWDFHFVWVSSNWNSWKLYIDWTSQDLSILLNWNTWNWFSDFTQAWSNAVEIGRFKTASLTSYFSWIIDEVKIYNRALWDKEIRQQAEILGFQY